MPFIFLEAGLRLFDVGRPGGAPDPLSGFNSNLPLFERKGAVYRTARAREPFFCSQTFAAQKRSNSFRIFCLGGSTVHGHPYQSDTAFPKWLELELAGSDASRSYQSVNCGGVSYASYRLVPVVREVLNYQPDLIIVATGENEFLEDRTFHALKARPALRAGIEDAVYSLRVVNVARNWLRAARLKSAGEEEDGEGRFSSEVKPRLDERSGYASYHREPHWHDQVAAQFERSIRAMVKMCRAAGVPILLVEPGCNLRDCPPFKSEHASTLSAQEETRWQTAFDEATAAEEPDPAHALALYRQVETLDAEYALLAYRIARVLDRSGKPSEALEYYRKARDDDVCPLRTISQHKEILRRIAAETKTPLTDAGSLLSAKSPDGIPGNDWYLDHVHPTIGGHQKIAQAIAAKMRETQLVPHGTLWREEKRRETYARQLQELGPRYFSDGKRRVEWLENWARRERLFDETLPRDASGYLRLGFKKLELGEEEQACEAVGAALRSDPGLAAVLRERAQELSCEGRSAAAGKLLQNLAAAQ